MRKEADMKYYIFQRQKDSSQEFISDFDNMTLTVELNKAQLIAENELEFVDTAFLHQQGFFEIDIALLKVAFDPTKWYRLNLKGLKLTGTSSDAVSEVTSTKKNVFGSDAEANSRTVKTSSGTGVGRSFGPGGRGKGPGTGNRGGNRG